MVVVVVGVVGVVAVGIAVVVWCSVAEGNVV